MVMNDADRPTRLLFICVENSNRSQMAEAFARMYGANRVEAYSAGSRPSKAVSDLPDLEYDVAVTMGCGDDCRRLRAKVNEDWNIPCPKALPPEQFRAIRDLIGEKVKALLERFSATGSLSLEASSVSRID